MHPVSMVALGGLQRQSIPGGRPACFTSAALSWLCLRLDSILSAALSLSPSFCQQGRHWECRQLQFSSVQSLSHVRLFVTPWTAAHQASLSITNSQSLPRLMSIESVMPSNHLILCCPLLLLPSALCIRWPKHWSFSFNIIPTNEHPGLISFRMDWLDLLAVQGTLKSLLQHHSSKASILWRSAFFLVQLSHPYMTNGKTITLTRWTFVGKTMTLNRAVLFIVFHSGCLLFLVPVLLHFLEL